MGLLKSKDQMSIEYDSILIIIDQLIQMVYYRLVLITLDAE